MFSQIYFKFNEFFAIVCLFLLVTCSVTSALSLDVIKDAGKHSHQHDHSHHDHHSHKDGICLLPLYGEDPTFNRRLFNLEETLASTLSTQYNTIKHDTSSEGILCSQYLQNYLKEYHDDLKAIKADRHRCSYELQSSADIVAENPLYTFKMIRRFVENLMKYTIPQCNKTVEGSLLLDIFDKSFENARLVPPELEDLDNAVNALLTLTFIYGLNVTSELRFGKFFGYKTHARLYFEDIMEITVRAIKQDDTGFISYQWLIAAEDALASEGTIPPEPSSRRLLNFYWQMAMGKLRKRSIGDLHKLFRGKKAEQTEEFEHDKLCLGITDEEMDITLSNNLACSYFWNFITPFAPMKLEHLSNRPVLVQIHDFLTMKEILFIKKEAPSSVVKDWFLTLTKPYSSSKEGQLEHFTKLAEVAITKNTNPVLANLVKKVQRLTRMDVKSENASIFEMGLYTPLSGFNNIELNHHSITGYNSSKENPSDATFLMFLTDVHMGGYTTFPEANIFVKPIKGSALYFKNYDYGIEKSEYAAHEACPVIIGVKEVANIPLHKPYADLIPRF